MSADKNCASCDGYKVTSAIKADGAGRIGSEESLLYFIFALRHIPVFPSSGEGGRGGSGSFGVVQEIICKLF